MAHSRAAVAEIVPGFHRVDDGFVNIYLAVDADGGLIVFDSGLARSGSKRVLAAIGALGKQPADLKHILITHTDLDHTGGAAALKAATGALVYAGRIEAEAMGRGANSRKLGGLAGMLSRPMGWLAPTPAVAADRVVSDGDVLPMLGGVRVIATPGHTPGHTSYFIPKMGVLVAGDSLNASGGTLRFAPAPVHWSYEEGLRSVAKQAGLGATVVVCGHGPAITAPRFPAPGAPAQ